MQNLQRFLVIIQREICADEAYLRIGGTPLEHSANLLTVAWREGCWFVAEWKSALSDEQKVHALRVATEFVVNMFTTDAMLALPKVPSSAVAYDVGRELDKALGVLARRARAEEALVIDHRSPEIWGSSEYPRERWNVEDALAADKIEQTLQQASLSLATLTAMKNEESLQALLRDKGFEATALRERARDVRWAKSLCDDAIHPEKLRVFHAIAAARSAEHLGHDSLPTNVRTRAFANIYRIVFVFDEVISELHIDSALHKMLPLIERLLLALPPREPTDSHRGGNVQALRRLRPL